MENKTEKTINKILSYFNAKIVGSYLFVKSELLELEELNDVDILVHKDVSKMVRSFLIDEGYKETKPPENIEYQGWTDGSLVFVHKNSKPIHILNNESEEVFDLEEIIGNKFVRGLNKDLEQIIKICQNKISKNNEDVDLIKKSKN